MGKAPKAPDPNAVVEAQKDANRLNTYTPYGATVFGSMNEAGEFVAKPGGEAVMSQETPFQKAQRERQQEFQTQFSGLAGDRLDAIMGETSKDGSNFGQNYGLPDAPAYQSSIDRSGFTQVPNLAGELQREYGQQGFGQNFDTQGFGQNFDGLDTSGLQGISSQGNFAEERQRIENATFNRQKRLMEPGFQQSREKLAQDLANRGLPIGSEASNRALDRMDRSQGQAMADLTDRSVALGGQEFARRQQQQMGLRNQQFGERQASFGAGQQQAAFDRQGAQLSNQQAQQRAAFDRQGAQLSNLASQNQAGFANQATQLANAMAANSRGVQSAEALQNQQMSNAARANQIREALATRNININEIGQLMGLSPQQPVPQMGGIAQIDAIGPAYQQYQGNLANYQANVGAAGDLAGAAGSYYLGRP